jgi:dsDNA-specific endonuclease/ATPase MutS2
VYVEPLGIVGPSNELKELQNELKVEENKIFSSMCASINSFKLPLKRSLSAAAEMDILRAKCRLGEAINGVVPIVGDEGCVCCHDAKHPLLLLKQLEKKQRDPSAKKSTIVGNDIELNQTAHAIVISGPNAGGKTIVLKTLGLYAFMVHYGIPVPAKLNYKLRVDYFKHILADIGDMQSVTSKAEYSTFSGHLFLCNEMVRIAQSAHHQNQLRLRKAEMSSSPRTAPVHDQVLVLLDEIGTGTDPVQGQALAQAILEELISLECRMLVTTHFAQLKELALRDSRFRVAAMEWLESVAATTSSKGARSATSLCRPTYKMKLGLVGESHALELAEKIFIAPHEQRAADADCKGLATYPSHGAELSSLHLSRNVAMLVRARGLLDSETLRLLYLQQQLDIEKRHMQLLQDEYTAKLEQLQMTEADLSHRQAALQQEIEKIQAGHHQEHLVDIKKKEQLLESYMQRAQAVIKQSILRSSSSSSSRVEQSVEVASGDDEGEAQKELGDMRNLIRLARIDAEKTVIQNNLNGRSPSSALKSVEVLPEKGDPLEAGTTLVVLEPGSLYGTRGTVAHRNKGRGRVALRVGGVEIKLERHLLGKPLMLTGDTETLMSAKERKFMQMAKEDLVDADQLQFRGKRRLKSGGASVSKASRNSLDLRGIDTIDAALSAITQFIERCIETNLSAFTSNASMKVFLEHGEDPVMAKRVRDALHNNNEAFVKSISIDDASFGDEAVTVLELDL